MTDGDGIGKGLDGAVEPVSPYAPVRPIAGRDEGMPGRKPRPSAPRSPAPAERPRPQPGEPGAQLDETA